MAKQKDQMLQTGHQESVTVYTVNIKKPTYLLYQS
jgi:hypothetical protein